MATDVSDGKFHLEPETQEFMLKLGNSGNGGLKSNCCFFFFLPWPYLLRSDPSDRFHDFFGMQCWGC